MSLWPGRRLAVALAGWTAAAGVVLVVPPAWPALAAALASLAVLTVWDARLLARRPPVRASRELPARAFVGRPATITLLLSATEPVAVDLVEELPRDLATQEPRFDDLFVAPDAAVALPYEVRPTLHGDRTLGALTVYERSPLGLLRRRIRCGERDVLPVAPDVSRYLGSTALDPRRVFAALGARPAPRRGEGMEFESLREYVPGDDPRRLDWAATARRGRPVVRLYQRERTHTVLVALDASRLMAARAQARTKLDHAIDTTLALAFAGLSSGDRVGLVVFDRRVRAHLTPRARRQSIGAFVEVLRGLEPRLVEADYGALARELSVRQRQHALCVVLTDFVEAESAQLVAPLAILARRHRVLLVGVRDPIFAPLEPGTRADRPDARSDPLDLYRRLALDDLLAERETTFAALRQRGVQTLDLPPERLTAPVLNRYLQLARGARG
jgi:uncharacterized protein (DUF58 family)